jgi:hypothetical protein
MRRLAIACVLLVTIGCASVRSPPPSGFQRADFAGRPLADQADPFEAKDAERDHTSLAVVLGVAIGVVAIGLLIWGESHGLSLDDAQR